MKFISFFFVFLLTSCYVPVSKLSKNLLGNSFYSYVKINLDEPSSSVLIDDAVKDVFNSRLNLNFSDEKYADSKIYISIAYIKYEAINYDEIGYISDYRVVLGLKFDTKFLNGTSDTFLAEGEYNFSLARKISNIKYADSIISQKEKFMAIRQASIEALNSYISHLALLNSKSFKG